MGKEEKSIVIPLPDLQKRHQRTECYISNPIRAILLNDTLWSGAELWFGEQLIFKKFFIFLQYFKNLSFLNNITFG